jgi:sugar lactone lactonase YvrE
VSPSGVITTVAGNGTAGFSGDGGPATAAQLHFPSGVAVDGAGDLYIADSVNERVRRVSPSGVIATVAGNGTFGFSGDGGPATAAQLGFPNQLAVDGIGNLYITDADNQRVRRVSPSGVISTVAGNGIAGFGGDGGPATAAALHNPSQLAVDTVGNLYIADTVNDRVRRVSPSGVITTVAGNGTAGFSGDGGPATTAELDMGSIAGVALDSAGGLYIADLNNHRIRKVSPSGVITTFAGNGLLDVSGDGGPAVAAALEYPDCVAVNAAGNLYIGEEVNARVREVSPTASRLGVTTQPPSSVAAGDAFTVTVGVLDANGNPVVGYGGPVSVAPGPNSPAGAVLGGTTTVTPVNGFATFNLSETTAGNFPFLVFTADGVTGTSSNPIGVAPLAPAALAFGQQPVNAVAGQTIAAVTVELLDRYGNVINGSASSGSVTLALGSNAGGAVLGGTATETAAFGVADFGDLTIDRAGTYTLVATSGTLQPVTSAPFSITSTSAFVKITTVAGGGTNGLGDGGLATAAQLSAPVGVAVDAAGDLFIADRDHSRVREVTPSGTITTVAGNGTPGFSGDGGPATSAALSSPDAVTVDSFGDLFISDGGTRVRRVSPSGVITTVAGNGTFGFSGDGGPATAAQLNGPFGLAVDGSGDLFITDRDNSRVREVTPSGIITTVAGSGANGFGGDGGPATAAALSGPQGVAVDAAGDLYIDDNFNYRVRRVSPSGVITSVAGSGTTGFSGDGGPATAAALDNPFGQLAVDTAGNLYIADIFNHRVRRVSPSGVITTVAGGGSGGDGGPATGAALDAPDGMAVDAAGDLFIGDRDDPRVREVLDPASRLAITAQPPAAVTAGEAFAVAVTLQDATGDPVSGFVGSVTLALSPGSPTGATLGGVTTASVDPDNGVATFNDLIINQPGTGYSLTASAAGFTSATTSPFNVGGATATQLVVTALNSKSPVTAGQPFTLTVEAQDAFGHRDATYTNETVSARLDPGSPAGAILGGALTATATNGIATFTGLTLSQPGKGFALDLNSPGLAGAVTFDVGAATATRLVTTTLAGVSAGSPFTFTVTAEDNAGNVATGFNGPVAVALGSNPAGATLGGVTTVNAKNGVATFTLSLNRSGTGFTLSASGDGFSTSTPPFGVGSVARLLFVLPPGGVTAGVAFGATVLAEDSSGNLITNFDGVVTLTTGPNSPFGSFLGSTTLRDGTAAPGPITATAVNGTASFSGLLLDEAGEYSLAATSPGLVGGFSAAFAVSPASAARLAVTPPAGALAASPFTAIVTVEDAFGNAVPAFNGSVTLALGNNPAGATLGGTLTASVSNGVATFSGLTLSRAGVGYTLTATAVGLPQAASLPFDVSAVTATQLVVVPPPYVLAGQPFAVTATATDAAGNLARGFNGLVTIALGPGSPAGTSLGGTLTAVALNGVATFRGLTLAAPGTGYTLTATDGTLSGMSAGSFAALAGGDGASSGPALSADGHFLAYVSAATDLVPGQAVSAFTNVFLYDITAGTSALVSRAAGSPSAGGAGNSDSPAIDADGGYTAFRSDAADLVGGQAGPAGGNIFLFARQGGALTLVSHAAGSVLSGAGGASAPAIDQDGHLVAYLSTAGNLVPGQTAPADAPAAVANVFVFYRALGGSVLASGQFGSLTVTGNASAGRPVLSRDPFPGYDSFATDLVLDAGGTSQVYVNLLVQVGGNAFIEVADATPAGTVLTALSAVDPAFAQGQFDPTPPAYALSGPGAAAFALGGVDGAGNSVEGDGSALLEMARTADYATQPLFSVVVTVTTLFGPAFAAITVQVSPPQAPTVAAVPDQVVTPGSGPSTADFTVGNLAAQGGPGAVTVTAVVDNATPGLLPAAGGVVVGGSGATRSVTVAPAPGRLGVVTITLTAAVVVDGRPLSTQTTFRTTVDSYPVFPAVGPVTAVHTAFPRSVLLTASSPTGRRLTLSAAVAGDAPLFDLRKQYAFTQQGVGYYDAGAFAYVLHSNRPVPGVGGFYLLRPADGALFAYDGSGSYAHTYTSTSPIATLGANVYTDPVLLLNAQPPVDYTTLFNTQQQYLFTAVGQITAGATAFVLHSNQAGPGVGGFYLIRPSDGGLFPYDGSGTYNNTTSGTPLAVLGAGVFTNPSLLLNAQAPPPLYNQLQQVNQQFDLQEFNGSFFVNNLGHQAKWLYSPILNQYGEHWYTLTLSASGTQSVLRAWQGYPDSTVGAVVATFNTPAVYNNPQWLTNATAVPDPPASVASVDGSGNLTVGLPNTSYAGTFTVTVTASDGLLSALRTVLVTSTDTAPAITVTQGPDTVASGSTRAFTHGNFPQTFGVVTSDAEGDTVSTPVATVTGYNPLFTLEQQFRFQSFGVHTAGATALVLQAAGTNSFGNPFYLVRPSDGGLFPYDGSGSYANTTTGTPIATLGANVYADPTLLTNADASINYATLQSVQQQYQFTSVGLFTAGVTALVLHSNQPGPGVGGFYLVRPSDGGLFPYDGSGNYNNTTSGTPLAVLGVDVVVNPSLLLNAEAAPALYTYLMQVEQQFDFQGVADAVAGAPAFVLKAALNNASGNPYYLLRADGSVWAYDGSGSYAHSFGNPANRVATLDPSIYTDPTLLTNAKAPLAAVGVTAGLSGGVLTVNSPSAFVGTVRVTVTANDGILTGTQSFFVTTIDTPPTLNAIPNQTVSASGPALQLTPGARDAERDTVSFSAQAVGYSPAFGLQQQYHFQGLGLFMDSGGVSARVLQVTGTNFNGNSFYLLKSDGGLYAYDGSGSYAHTFANSANLVATLDPSVYTTPTLLTDAKAPAAPGANVAVSGTTLSVDATGLTPGTVFRIFVTAADGAESMRTSFLVTVKA